MWVLGRVHSLSEPFEDFEVPMVHAKYMVAGNEKLLSPIYGGRSKNPLCLGEHIGLAFVDFDWVQGEQAGLVFEEVEVRHWWGLVVGAFAAARHLALPVRNLLCESQ